MKPNRNHKPRLTYATAIVGKRMLADEILRIKDAVIIRYVHRWGGNWNDNKFWQAEMNGEIYDWNPKEILIDELNKKGLRWMVIQHHNKNNEATILQKG